MKNSSNLCIAFILFSIITLSPGCVNPELPLSELPSNIKTLEINTITSSTAISGGTIENDGGEKIVTRGICYSSETNPTITNSLTRDGNGTGNFTSTINGLTPNTTYYLRAYATNSVGTAYGNEIVFKTLRGIIDIKTNPVKSITTNSATIGGVINSDGGISIISSGLCWDRSSDPTIELSTKTSNAIKSGSFQTSLTGLIPNTAYYVRAYATSMLSTTYGDQVSFATKTDEGTVFDIDGNGYTTVTLFGTQTWLVENLKTTKYRDGSSIPSVEDNTEWAALSTGACCNYNNDIVNFVKYGKLYNWYAISDGRKIAPIGWHVPNVDEWTNLTKYYAYSFAAKTDWSYSSVTNAIGNDLSKNNSSGFTALPGGSRGYDGVFTSTSNYAHWWLTTTNPIGLPWEGYMVYNKSSIDLMAFQARCGFSVRCVKDGPPTITSTKVGQITQTTLSIETNVITQDGADVLTSGVCWSTSENPTISNNKTNDGNGKGIFTSSINGLLPNTTYYVRSYATNSLGVGYGNQLNLKTYGSYAYDIDGNVYNTISIGTQIWMVENLSTTKYSNGDNIYNVTNNNTWANISNNTGAWCNYNNDASLGNKYGKLYNFFAVNDSRSIAPNGWHVPSYEEWTALINYLGGQTKAGGKLKEIGIVNWSSPNTSATNESEFSALPGGFRYNFDGTFKDIGNKGYWWSSYRYSSSAYYCYIANSSSNIYLSSDWSYTGCSVRCIKD